VSQIAIVGELSVINTAKMGIYFNLEALPLAKTLNSITPAIVTKVNCKPTMKRSLGQRVNGTVIPYPL
jgi:hypothetical protein